MTWIKLYQEGSPIYVHLDRIMSLQAKSEGIGSLLMGTPGSVYVDEIPEQIIALIAEAEREDRERRTVDVAEPPDLTDEEADRLYNEAAAKARPFSSEQIDRMIAATVKREPPKIDSQKLWALIRDFEVVIGWANADPNSFAETVNRIRDRIRKELGL